MAFKTRKSKGQEETPAPRGQYNNNRRSAVCVSPDPLARGEDPLAVAVQLRARHMRRFDEVDARMAVGDAERLSGIETVLLATTPSETFDGRRTSFRVLEASFAALIY